MKSPEINPYTYALITFDKCAKTIPWGNDCLFNKLDIHSHAKESSWALT